MLDDKVKTFARRRGLLRASAGLAAGLVLAPWAAVSHAGDAADLRATYDAMAGRLAAGALGLPIVIDSVESAAQLSGSVFAISKHPFATVAASFARPQVWCDVMLLPFNSRSCQLDNNQAGPELLLTLTRKNADDASQGHPLRLDWRKTSSDPDYLEVHLGSESGPLGTANYMIVLRAISLPQNRSFMHFTFALRFGTAARLATQAYLATAGRSKVGFSVVGSPAGEQLVGGMRGIVERNAMRHFLGIEAWLNSSRLPAAQQLDARQENWFDATERYPRQLHEMDKAT
ncbi:MAG TPA: hypothetical protein VLJ57_01200, partial [Burkholderiaceae bacterium]|nr:hypothetical protein [Burkholderiaceae bacterium]